MAIRVLIVEDSLIAQAILKRLLNHPPRVEVVGIASTGLEALKQIAQTEPDVICTDLHMPQMNGLELTQEVMAHAPRPILVFSTSVQKEDTQTVFKLLEAGAVDVVPKPRIESPENYAQLQQHLLQRIQVLAGVKVFTRKPQRRHTEILNTKVSRSSANFVRPLCSLIRPRIVAIGASTGGPQAFKTILSQLPSHFSVPVLCVQHISVGFLTGLLDWLRPLCLLPIQIATAGERPQPGTIYFAPEQFHLEIDYRGCFAYSARTPVDGHRPSVTVLFNSVAAYYKASALGVLLTGMGQDGAYGLQAIDQAGGQTIAQNKASSVVFGMPQEAIALGAAQQILSLETIAPMIIQQCCSQLDD
ncbi:MAG: chemotaxis-specific protein-glutamate methyltransferase CheB [Spirulina sp. SIO3F2]|nr:chemotaxis-specific protein-glutamate methyltransferase CheB [Spirulina sp. SIO3F2]